MHQYVSAFKSRSKMLSSPAEWWPETYKTRAVKKKEGKNFLPSCYHPPNKHILCSPLTAQNATSAVMDISIETVTTTDVVSWFCEVAWNHWSCYSMLFTTPTSAIYQMWLTVSRRNVHKKGNVRKLYSRYFKAWSSTSFLTLWNVNWCFPWSHSNSQQNKTHCYLEEKQGSESQSQ